MGHEEIFRLTLTETAQSIRQGELSAERVADAFLCRAESLNKKLNAFVCFDRDYVLSQARDVDLSKRDGKLKGVPIGIKDVINTLHYPTQKGSSAWAGYQAGNDARCVFYLRQEQGLVFGKTDTAELAVHAFGKAKNPYEISRVTGTSSGGSAAAVASGMVPAALGTQTGGSITRPASWCGVYAMKPSFGLVPRTGVLKTTDTLDSVGFFGRSVDDLDVLLDTVRIHGDNFPIQEKAIAKYKKRSRDKWRVAFVTPHFAAETSSYVALALDRFQTELSKISDVQTFQLDLPKETVGFHDLHRRIYHPCLAYYLRTEHRGSAQNLSQVLHEIFEDAQKIPPADYGVAMSAQAELATALERFFQENDLDAIFVNSSVGTAPNAEPSKHFDYNSLWTMAWLPVVNVPVFAHEGMPFGLQAVGPRYSDHRLLELCKHITAKGLFPRASTITD